VPSAELPALLVRSACGLEEALRAGRGRSGRHREPEAAVPIRKYATPDNLISLSERSPSPPCRERSCVRIGCDRAGEFRREQGSCSPAEERRQSQGCSSARGEEFPRLIASAAARAGTRVEHRQSRRSFLPSPQRDRSGHREAVIGRRATSATTALSPRAAIPPRSSRGLSSRRRPRGR